MCPPNPKFHILREKFKNFDTTVSEVSENMSIYVGNCEWIIRSQKNIFADNSNSKESAFLVQKRLSTVSLGHCNI